MITTMSDEKYRLIKLCHSFSLILCLFSLVFPLMAAAGWIFQIPLLSKILPTLLAMQPNTVLALILSAIATLLSLQRARSSVHVMVVCFLGLFIFVLGIATLSEYTFGWNPGFDRLLFRRNSRSTLLFPGRPSPQTSLNFILLGISLLALNLRFLKVTVGQMSALLLGANALIAMTGFIFGTENPYGFPILSPSIGIAIHTAVSFIFLAAALLLSRPNEGIIALVTSDTRSGGIARKVLVSCILLPPLIGMLIRLGVIAGWYHSSDQVSLFSVVIIGLILRTTWRSAKQAETEELRFIAAKKESEYVNQILRKTVEEREIFSALIENSSDYIGIADPNGKPIYLNQAGRRMVGLPPDFPVEGTQISEYYSADQRTFATEVIVKAVIEKGHWEGETSFRNWKTEEAIPVSDEQFLIRDTKDHRIIGMGTVTRDISYQKRIEREQRFLADVGVALASTLDYESILEIIVDLVVRDVADICVLTIVEEKSLTRRQKVMSRESSKAWACDRLMQIEPSQTQSSPWNEALQNKRTVVIEDIQPDLIEAWAQNDEHLRLLRALEMRSLLVTPLLVHGKLLGTIALISSTSERNYTSADIPFFEAISSRATLAIENAHLYRESQRVKLIADNLPSLIAYWDKDQKCRYANRAYIDWFGFDPEYLIGRTIKELLGPALYKKNSPYINGALRGIEQHFERDLIVRSTGALRHMSMNYIPDIVAGNVVGFFVLVYDVTELKNAEIAAAAERDKALGAVNIREEVLAIVSHDLKNPLSAIGLSAQYLQQHNKLKPPQLQDISNRIQRSVDQMQTLIGDLLAFSAIRAGTFSVEKYLERPCQVIQPVIESIRVLAEAKSLHLKIDVSPVLPAVACDANRVGQVLSNLLGNAIKFTPTGGTIRVSAKEIDEGILVSVSDTGPGIPPDLLPEIFDRFWQAKETKHLGSGLGLSIAKGIMEAHGTRIWAESQVGIGSRFFFILPLATSETRIRK